MQLEDPPAGTISPDVGVKDRNAASSPAAPGARVARRARAAELLASLRTWSRAAVIRPAPFSRALFVAGLKAAIVPFLVSRALVWIATGFGARYVPAPPGLSTSLNPPAALAPFFHWDANAYGYIAQHGYLGPVATQQLIVAWFPFYPLLIHLAGGSDWAMIIIPNVCFFASLALLYVLGVKWMDADRARLTLWLVSLGPAAMFFSYPYTESVFLLLTVGAFVLMESGHWLLAGVGGMAAAMTRGAGVLVAVALGAEGVLGSRRRVALVAAALPVAGLLTVSLIDWVQMGDPLGFVHAQAYWIGPNRSPFYLVGSFPRAALEGDPFRPEAIAVPVFVIFVIGAVWVFRRMPISYAAFAATQLFVAARQGLYVQYLSPVPRYVAVIFPCYFAFATLLGPRRNLQLAWLLISASILVINAVLYGGWRSIS